uniref:Opsin n=1 Tax=Podocoryna carnea TaxID=6096 RepID=A9CR60_PODCA|nr:opsin [Podocoryna carnea]
MDRTTFTAFLTIIVALSASLNTAIIIALIRTWNKLSSYDVTLLFLTTVELLQAVIGYPIELTTNLREGGPLCIIAGYSTTTLALTSISILVALSFMRLLSVTQPLKAVEWIKTRRYSIYLILPSCIYGFMWGIFPLIGWSEYAPELGSNKRCTIDLHSEDNATRSYLYSLLLFCYVLPLTTMTINFYKIRKKIIEQSVKLSQNRERIRTNRIKRERRLAIATFVMTVVFLVAWTPYAVAIFIIGFQKRVDEAWFFMDYSSLLAKSSTFFNPLIYVLMHRKCKTAVVDMFQYIICLIRRRDSQASVSYNGSAQRVQFLHIASMSSQKPDTCSPCVHIQRSEYLVAKDAANGPNYSFTATNI